MADGNTYTNEIIVKLADSSKKEIAKKAIEDEKAQAKARNKFNAGIQEFISHFSDGFREKVLKLPESFSAFMGNLGTSAAIGVASLMSKVGDAILKYLGDIYEKAKEMISDISLYSGMANTFSKEATNMALEYGLTGKEAYAWTEALKDVGFSDLTDYIENGWAATKQTQDRLEELLNTYRESYDKNKSMSASFENFKKEWEDIKTKFGIEIINFFSENKSLIKEAMNVILWTMKGIFNAVKRITQFLGTEVEARTDAQKASDLSDIVNSGVYTTNNSTAYNQSNVFNVSASDLQAATTAANNQYQVNYAYLRK